MFEEKYDVKNEINPHSYNPHKVAKPQIKLEEQYEDTEEYRKSLNMPDGPEKDALLAGLKKRLGLDSKGGVGDNKKVQWQGVGKEGMGGGGKDPGASYQPKAPEQKPTEKSY